MAIALATIWAHFSISRTIAEVWFRPGQAALRSVYDVLRDRPPDWKPVFNVRTTSWYVELSVGRATYMLQIDQWPDHVSLRNAARESFQPQTESSSHV